jgi:predicted ribonuclease toxin of YeeF-YezG toxin-antitoxin module
MEQKTKQAEKEISATEKALKELSQARQTEMEQCRNEISVIL